MAENESIEELKKQLEAERKKSLLLEEENLSFKLPGKAKMYYALNRNLNDLADLLNATPIKHINLDDPKDKSVERLKLLWGAVEKLSGTVAIMGQSAGVTGDEEKDLGRPFIETVAERRN